MQDYVVLDVESTGVLPTRDRIIEIAMLRCRQDQIINEMTTLINPKRDLGPTSIHGITASQVLDAPTFSEVAGDILDFLRGATVVAHNAQFDVGLLSAEFNRIGVQVGTLPSFCTMSFAYQFGPESRRLEHCCAHFGIPLTNAHAAYNDALAALQLFRRYLDILQAKQQQPELTVAFRPGCSLNLPVIKPSGKRLRRDESSHVRHGDFISRLIEKLPNTGSIETVRYYAALDRALEDRRITEREMSELETITFESGLSKNAVQSANQEYLNNLVHLALADGKITPSEKRDLENVASLLGVNDIGLASLIKQAKAGSKAGETSETPKPTTNLQNKTVCFTGVLTGKLQRKLISRAQAEALATAAGLIPVPSVTKKTDILVVADPDTMSGKAKKAHENGTRIMAEPVFWNAIGVQVD